MKSQNRSPKGEPLSDRLQDARGFSILQTLITLAVLSVVSTFVALNINSTRSSLRLQN